jgi:hypothetical protein
VKNTKNIFVSILSIILLVSQTLCIAHDLTFELFNKSEKALQWTLVKVNPYKKDDRRTIILRGDLPSGQKGYLPSQQENETAFEAPLLFLCISRHSIDYCYDIASPGKTKYLTWNPTKKPYLYPQAGSLMGLTGKTESGLPLKNNVNPSEIKDRNSLEDISARIQNKY